MDKELLGELPLFSVARELCSRCQRESAIYLYQKLRRGRRESLAILALPTLPPLALRKRRAYGVELCGTGHLLKRAIQECGELILTKAHGVRLIFKPEKVAQLHQQVEVAYKSSRIRRRLGVPRWHPWHFFDERGPDGVSPAWPMISPSKVACW